MLTYPAYQENIIAQLRGELYDILTVAEVSVQRGHDQVIAFTGQLLQDAETAFALLRERFERYGYTPFFRKQAGQDVILAARGLVRPQPSNWLINLVLLVATVFTTLFAGAVLAGANPLRDARQMWAGVPFAFTLLGILGVHELGHYFMARWHGVAVTLPYFIPMPFGLGTFGAFIRMKSPVANKKALFDVGLAGPLAGFSLAVPLLIMGLLLSPVRPLVGQGSTLGTSLLVEFLVNLVRPHPQGFAVYLHPIAFAAWFGLLITGFNLLPAGQLDGGHVAYALLGRRTREVAVATLLGLVAMGALFWQGWLTWAFLILLTGIGHPAPLNDITPLDPGRRTLGWLTFGLLFLLITPAPFRF
ncbi:MAG: site-2 protease family protein [Anaerolineae bacterium]